MEASLETFHGFPRVAMLRHQRGFDIHPFLHVSTHVCESL